MLEFEIDRTAIKWPARIEEIINIILFLTSSISSYIYSAALIINSEYTI